MSQVFGSEHLCEIDLSLLRLFKSQVTTGVSGSIAVNDVEREACVENIFLNGAATLECLDDGQLFVSQMLADRVRVKAATSSHIMQAKVPELLEESFLLFGFNVVKSAVGELENIVDIGLERF